MIWKKSIEIWQYCHYTRNQGPWVLSEQVGDKGLILAFRCRMTIKICIDSRVWLNWKKSSEKWQYCHHTSESGALGPQRAGGRQRVKTDIVGVGLRLNLYKSSFDVIWRNPSKSGNIATTPPIKGPGFSASRWRQRLVWHLGVGWRLHLYR